MRRLLIGIALGVALIAVTAASSGAKSSPFRPETAASVGTKFIWVLGSDGLLRSTDGGRTFARVSAPPVGSQVTVPSLVFANAEDGFAYVWGTTGLYATHDGGRSWHRAGPVGKVFALAVGGGDVYLAAGNTLERSPVSRDAWRKLPLSVSTQRLYLAALGTHVWLLSGPRHRPDYDTIRISSDRGRSFAARKGPCLAELGGRLSPAGGGVVWAVCPTGMMAMLSLSTNGGRSFAIRSFHDPGGTHQPALTNGGEIAPASPRMAVLYGGGNGALHRTTDSGRHWTRVAGTGGLEEVFTLGFSTSRDGIMLATTRSHSRAQLWRTTDGGASWHVVPLR